MIPWIVFAVGACLRAAMMLNVKSLWGDEFYSLDYALGPEPWHVLRFCFSANHPPVYYWFLRVSSQIFGESDIAFRLMSFIPGILMTPVVYALAARLLDKRTALWAALFVAVSPYYLQMSNEVRSYSLVGLMTCVAWLCYLRVAESGASFARKAAYVAAVSSMVYIEHIAMFPALAMMLWVFWKKPPLRRTQVLALGLMAPWAALMVYQAVYYENVLIVGRVMEYFRFGWQLKKVAGIFWHMLGGYRYAMMTVPDILHSLRADGAFIARGSAAFVFSILAITGFVAMFREKGRAMKYAAGTFLIPFVIFLFLYPIRLDARYMTIGAPALFIALAYAVSRLKPRLLSMAVGALFILFSLGESAYAISLKTDVVHKEDLRGMIRYTLESADEDTIVIMGKQEMEYYSRQLKMPIRAKVVESTDFLDKSGALPSAGKIWILKTVNMHPDVTERIVAEDAGYLVRLGFVPAGHKQIGGENSLCIVYYFQRV